MSLRILEIEDTSDCDTCTRRDADAWELLRTAKADLLTGITCPECGREVDLWVEDMSHA